MDNKTKFNETLSKFDSLKKTEDFEELPSNEKVNVIFLTTIKKLEMLDDHVRQFVDEHDQENHQMLDKLFTSIRDDLIEVAIEVQGLTNKNKD